MLVSEQSENRQSVLMERMSSASLRRASARPSSSGETGDRPWEISRTSRMVSRNSMLNFLQESASCGAWASASFCKLVAKRDRGQFLADAVVQIVPDAVHFRVAGFEDFLLEAFAFAFALQEGEGALLDAVFELFVRVLEFCFGNAAAGVFAAESDEDGDD